MRLPCPSMSRMRGWRIIRGVGGAGWRGEHRIGRCLCGLFLVMLGMAWVGGGRSGVWMEWRICISRLLLSWRRGRWGWSGRVWKRLKRKIACVSGFLICCVCCHCISAVIFRMLCQSELSVLLARIYISISIFRCFRSHSRDQVCESAGCLIFLDCLGSLRDICTAAYLLSYI